MDERFEDTRKSKNPVIRAIGPGRTNTSQSLYERIGGEKVLDQIVTDVYNWMRADKDMGKQFARFRLERLKERTVDYLRGEWGGPEPYKGSDLWIAHSHIGIKNQWYDIMMKLFVKACKKARLPKKETAEVLESIEKMREPMVDSNLRLKNMYLKYTDKLAQEAGGDGWGTVAATQEEREQKERETLERIQKMKEQEALEEAKRRMDALELEAKAGKASEGLKKGKKVPDDGASDSTKEPTSAQSSGEIVKAAAKPKAKPKAKKEEPPKPKVDPAFDFSPLEDAPPAQLQSSAPSGAELLYRLSRPCVGFAR